nr:hypothetical protein BaRGS_030177 [Batillaria attramentaria]
MGRLPVIRLDIRRRSGMPATCRSESLHCTQAAPTNVPDGPTSANVLTPDLRLVPWTAVGRKRSLAGPTLAAEVVAYLWPRVPLDSDQSEPTLAQAETLRTFRLNKKPLMEKRRRARINSCLSQLKSLVLQAIKKDSSQFSKLEKADILELTVKHLRALQRQQAAGVMTSDPNVVSKYRAGFNECAKEVIRYMGSVRDVNDDVKERVVGHLAGCLQVVNHVTPAESIQQQQQQQCMKPLHVHIPPQGPVNAAISGLSMSGVSTAPTAVISHNQQHISGAFKIVPSSACPGGAVALYLGRRFELFGEPG